LNLERRLSAHLRRDHADLMAEVSQGAHEGSDMNRAALQARGVNAGIMAEVQNVHGTSLGATVTMPRSAAASRSGTGLPPRRKSSSSCLAPSSTEKCASIFDLAARASHSPNSGCFTSLVIASA